MWEMTWGIHGGFKFEELGVVLAGTFCVVKWWTCTILSALRVWVRG
jgi:hypothetical protein